MTLGKISSDIAAVLLTFGVEGGLANALAHDLSLKFYATAPIDWTSRPFGSASVSVDIKRILRMNGVESSKVDSIAQAVFDRFFSHATNALAQSKVGG